MFFSQIGTNPNRPLTGDFFLFSSWHFSSFWHFSSSIVGAVAVESAVVRLGTTHPAGLFLALKPPLITPESSIPMPTQREKVNKFPSQSVES
ncbi:hypothetical protein niasHS_003109 [Heterodera schachtii]|uniref:Uncharacterized protein n=1 Tax=Heterodera schachtii TaxID=97005 RepID=A0ABD2KAT8_HETSC